MAIKIYVGNLAYSVTESVLGEQFASYGTVDSTKIVTDRYTGNSRGFAFVEMANRQQAEDAIQALNGRELNGRKIKVSEARPRKDRGSPRSGRPYGSKY